MEIKKERDKLHNEELHNLNFLPGVTGMIKSRRLEWEVM
jgi:hypothetical protein